MSSWVSVSLINSKYPIYFDQYTFWFKADNVYGFLHFSFPLLNEKAKLEKFIGGVQFKSHRFKIISAVRHNSKWYLT